jgi:malonyl-ACP decarboxylase
MLREYNSRTNKGKIEITGMGIQCADAHSILAFKRKLYEGCTNFSVMNEEAYCPGSPKIAALLSSFVFNEQLALLTELPSSLLAKAQLVAQRAPFPVQAAVVSVLQAWLQAQLHERVVARDRIGLVVACDSASQRYQYDMQQKFIKSPEYLSPRYALHSLPTDYVGTISQMLCIHGEGFTVSAASASGNVAILKASQLIQLGIVDVCLVVGALSDLSPLALQGFYNAGAMGGVNSMNNPKSACRPFDALHDGFIYGQGSGCLILEASALPSIDVRRAQPLAHFLSGVLRLDGNALPNPSEEGEVMVMSRCLAQAGMTPHDVDYMNTHGSSSPLGDITEINAIKRVFKQHVSELWINATKGLTGHCLFSAGIIEAIACVIQLQHRFVHPNINLCNPIDTTCRFAPDKATPAALNVAMSNSFGFGGMNSSILLGSVPI